MTSAVCSPSADSAFGPTVDGCRQGFDFTFAFEQYFFSIAPSLLLLFFAPIRLKFLSRVQPRINASSIKYVKLSVVALLAVLQLTLVILCANNSQIQARTPSLVASVLSFAATLALCALSYMEHSRSLRPSMLLNAYLLATFLLDAATLRTLWMLTPFSTCIRDVSTAIFSIKGIVLLLEAKEKSALSGPEFKKKSPEDYSGLYGQAFLSWLNRLICQGARHLLKPDDLYPITHDVASEVLNIRFQQELSGQSEARSTDLRKVIFNMLKWPIIVPVLPRLTLIALTFCQPLLLKRLLTYLNNSSSNLDENIGYGLIGAYLIVYIGIATTSAIYWHRHYRFLIMLRGTLITAVYAKATKLSTAGKGNTATITLMSTDVERVVRGLIDLHEMWANIIQVAIATWLIGNELGAACVGPIVVATIATGATIWFSGHCTSFQLRWVKKIEDRIGITTSALGAMKAIKLTGLTSRVSSLLCQSRTTEVNAARRFRSLSAVSVAIGNVPQLISPVLTFAIYMGIASKNHTTLDTTKLFTSLSLLLLASEPLFTLIAGLMDLMSAIGCFARIQTFLQSSIRTDDRQFASSHTDHGPPSPSPYLPERDAVRVENASFGWTTGEQSILKNISFCVQQSQLVIIVGAAASGKSTLLKGLLGETPVSEGCVYLNSSNIAWCEQSAWLTNASVQKNIIGYSEFDPELYSSVIHACDLESDLENLPKDDLTVIGSKGFALSGGQKQRIALARAVYSRYPVFILDDIFSQLDLSTQTTIFNRLLGPQGLLRRWKATVILATHAVKFLPYADHIIALSLDGSIETQGGFDEHMIRGGYVTGCISEKSNDEAEAANPVSISNLSDTTADKTVKVYIAEGDNKPEENPLDSARQQGDTSIYGYYFACISWTVAVTFLLLQFCYAFLSVFPAIWLKWWADSNNGDPDSVNGYYIGAYAALQVGALVFSAIVTWWSFNVMAVKTGIKLHNILVKTVMSASFAFFSSVDSGNILTRFSQDIQLLDMSLPLALQVVTTNILICLGQMGLIASASAWIALSFPVLFLVFFFVQKFYLRTSRQMRYLDLEGKAPVYTQFIETLDGLAIIRAFNWGQLSINHNFELVDRSQKPYYLMYAIQRWLALVLDLIITAIAVLVVGVVIALRGRSSPGFTGVSLTQIISFTSNIKLLIMFWTQMETSLGAVARIRQFEKDTVPEDQPGETYDPSFDWPSRGAIEISGLSAKYKPDAEKLTLEDINISIPAGARVGFCGRTGSGKSSLVLSCFRLLDTASGTIKIDGVDLAAVRRETLRSRLVAIAEEPFFFPTTVRANLDPESTISDEAMISSLEKTKLWDTIEAKGGLNAQVSDVHLSQGQKQLFNIARALLRREGKVLFMDEATSSVDLETDKHIQSLIREEFKNHTIIAVAHRLETILDFDFVGVMDRGRLVEYESPKTLLQRNSLFKELYKFSAGERADV